MAALRRGGFRLRFLFRLAQLLIGSRRRGSWWCLDDVVSAAAWWRPSRSSGHQPTPVPAAAAGPGRPERSQPRATDHSPPEDPEQPPELPAEPNQQREHFKRAESYAAVLRQEEDRGARYAPPVPNGRLQQPPEQAQVPGVREDILQQL